MSKLIISVSGVRGIFGDSLTPQIAKQFGEAFATTLPAGATVVLGRDSRPSGQSLQDAVIEGLISRGINIIDIGIATTPGTAVMVKHLSADGGIVITASHNPPAYNGLKFLSSEGRSLPADRAKKLKEIWESCNFPPAKTSGQVSTNNDVHKVHTESVLKIVDADAIARKNFKVVLDSINGAGCQGSAILLNQLGCQLVHINNKPDGQFAHEPEPIEKNLTHLCHLVKQEKADIGFAQDPDADRLAVVDQEGRFVGEEYTLALALAFVLKKHKGPVATNLSASRMIDDITSSAGVELFRTPVGEANVVDAMVKHNCIFGGEGNGGVIDPRVVLVRDSFVAIALILNYLAETDLTVSQLINTLPRYVMHKDKLPCPREVIPEILQNVKGKLASSQQAKISEEDGLRVDLPDCWVHIRPSNTEPIIRIIVEGKDETSTRQLAQQVRQIAEDVLKKQ